MSIILFNYFRLFKYLYKYLVVKSVIVIYSIKISHEISIIFNNILSNYSWEFEILWYWLNYV